MRASRRIALAALTAAALGSLAGAQPPALAVANGPGLPVPPTAAPADSLVREGESHFAQLWQLTFGGQNAEAYWSADGKRLIFQSTRDGWPCDQEFVYELGTGAVRRISSGKGRTTCGYFYDHDRRVLYSTTGWADDSCPPPLDYSKGYVWRVDPDYDIFTARPDGSDLRRLTRTPGYDAEATLSTDEKWIVFTSMRDHDLELYKMRPDGSGLARLTNRIGYDGGAFFSHDGQWICYRAGYPESLAAETDYRALLEQSLVRPTHMNLWIMRADGSDKRQLTDRPGASFAPYFLPDDSGLIFSSNWENPRGRNFDLYIVGKNGGELSPVTRDPTFDGFPMFSPDGRWLVFASNRGGKIQGETNLFLARWRP